MTQGAPKPHPHRGPHWDALKAFAEAEIAVRRGHARCFRLLADLIAVTRAEAFAELPAELTTADAAGLAVAEYRAIAQRTDDGLASVEAALRRDDRADVADFALSCVGGYLRGLDAGQWGERV